MRREERELEFPDDTRLPELRRGAVVVGGDVDGFELDRDRQHGLVERKLLLLTRYI